MFRREGSARCHQVPVLWVALDESLDEWAGGNHLEAAAPSGVQGEADERLPTPLPRRAGSTSAWIRLSVRQGAGRSRDAPGGRRSAWNCWRSSSFVTEMSIASLLWGYYWLFSRSSRSAPRASKAGRSVGFSGRSGRETRGCSAKRGRTVPGRAGRARPARRGVAGR
jgi:hypothetical protein